MTDLIARLEAATEGSLELDAEIWMTLYPNWRNFPRTEDGGWITDMGKSARAYGYTTSLDAAMTLVPEGAFVELHISPKGTSCDAEVSLNDGKFLIADDTVKTSTAATAPLALCIAALKARETTNE